MSDVVSRLLAAIDERERKARAAGSLQAMWWQPGGRRNGRNTIREFLTDNDPDSVLRLCQAHRDIVAMFPVSAPHLDTHGSFYGFESRDCGEHRTVGPHRAWCFDCSEWCYPGAPCQRCHGVSDVIKTLARGYGVEDGETK